MQLMRLPCKMLVGMRSASRTYDSAFYLCLGATSCAHISQGRRVLCQHGAFSGVGAIVASFVSTECPVGMGMWGIFGKPLKEAFRRCMG